jgi:phenylalanyl-tRNA synthetase beta chain
VPPGDTAAWDVTPPSWRPDLQRPVDLVEEVVRLEGYSGLPVTVPRAPAGSGLTRVQRQRRRAGRALAAAGFTEVVSVPFVAAEAADRLQLGPGDARRPSVRLANAVSDEEPWLRSTLLPGLLAALTRNVGRGFPDVALFEIGPVFRRRADQAAMPALTAGVRPSESELAQLEQALPDQPPHAGGVLAGRWERPGWWGPGRAAGWADAVEAARTVLGAVGGEVSVVAATDVAPWHPGRCAALSVAGEVVGHAGELHPRVVEALGLPARTAAFEVSLAGLLAIDPPVISVPALSTYPIAAFDVAVVVARDVPVAEVAAALRSGAGPLLESLRLFDVYGGDQIGGGEVSYAFAARLRAPDRTLTAEEVAEVRDAAVSAARERTGARLRA